MEIEVGEFVRIKNQGINKIIKIDNINRYILELDIVDNYGELTDILEKYQLEQKIVKHSKNIIDLIEEDDYVNGFRVEEITKDEIISNNVIIKKEWIREILTHEQYEENTYKLEE